MLVLGTLFSPFGVRELSKRTPFSSSIVHFAVLFTCVVKRLLTRMCPSQSLSNKWMRAMYLIDIRIWSIQCSFERVKRLYSLNLRADNCSCLINTTRGGSRAGCQDPSTVPGHHELCNLLRGGVGSVRFGAGRGGGIWENGFKRGHVKKDSDGAMRTEAISSSEKETL